MLRIGICDDLADARLVLRSALERILENRKIQGQFFEFSSGETLLRWYDHHAGELDVVFLDMELHELDGMETARRLRAADAGLQLVFVTGYADHVYGGFVVKFCGGRNGDVIFERFPVKFGLAGELSCGTMRASDF